MRKRWTMAELDQISDGDLVRAILRERHLELHSEMPFTKRLGSILRRIEIGELKVDVRQPILYGPGSIGK